MCVCVCVHMHIYMGVCVCLLHTPAYACISRGMKIHTAVMEGYYCHLLSHKRLSSLRFLQGVLTQMCKSAAHALLSEHLETKRSTSDGPRITGNLERNASIPLMSQSGTLYLPPKTNVWQSIGMRDKSFPQIGAVIFMCTAGCG